MGKNIKGKECGKGICQRKDGRYTARFTDKFGNRKEKHFHTIQEARNWLEDMRYADRHGNLLMPEEMTVDTWFGYWIENVVGDLSPNTRRMYQERYQFNIQPVVGAMRLTDVKPIHCKMVLNGMEKKYAGSTIRQTFITMGTIFRSAVQNDLLVKHPMDGVKYNKPVRAVDDIKFLTVEEQKKFLEVAQRSHNYYQYALLLETGLRTGELVGLTWNAIDWKKRTLTVNKTMEYRYGDDHWRVGPPKTAHSYRTIPLTNRAYEILEAVKANRPNLKESPALDETLVYTDLRTGKPVTFKMRDIVFINFRTGEPAKNSSYDTHLYKLCDEAGIKRICMHALRHTYATRAIERGVRPKDLQKLLGHSSIKMTMDRYVHVTEESLISAVHQFEAGQSA